MGEIKLVASDLDGTLLRPDETVSERTRDAIAAARRAGITLVLVTGRPPRSLASIAARIASKLEYFPVPRMRREPNSRPAMVNVSCTWLPPLA